MRVESLGEIILDPRSSGKIKFALRGLRARPTWFSIPDYLARSFLVSGLSVDGRSQLFNQGALPATLFSESEGSRIDIARSGLATDAGDEVVLELVNVTGFPAYCRVIMLGIEESDPRLPDPICAVGYGYTQVSGFDGRGFSGHANINVQPSATVVPFRIHVPDLDLFEVEGVFTSSGRADAASLSEDSLRAGGSISLAPVSTVSAGQFLTVAVKSKHRLEQSFRAAVLARPATKIVEERG